MRVSVHTENMGRAVSVQIIVQDGDTFIEAVLVSRLIFIVRVSDGGGKIVEDIQVVI